VALREIRNLITSGAPPEEMEAEPRATQA
jgi:hypothetical protein